MSCAMWSDCGTWTHNLWVRSNHWFFHAPNPCQLVRLMFVLKRRQISCIPEKELQGIEPWTFSHYHWAMQAPGKTVNKVDSEGIRTPAGRAQWISSPSPWPLGHTVMFMCPCISILLAAARVANHNMARQYDPEMPTLGFEPRLSRPQRDVLTTRRCRQMMKLYFMKS